MIEQAAASAVTNSCAQNPDILRNARWALEKRSDVLLDHHSDDGEWVDEWATWQDEVDLVELDEPAPLPSWARVVGIDYLSFVDPIEKGPDA